MTAIQIYKFIHEKGSEFHWCNNYDCKPTPKRDVILFVNIWDIEEFNELLKNGYQDEGGISCTMKQGYFAFWMSDILDCNNIKIEEVFGEDTRATT